MAPGGVVGLPLQESELEFSEDQETVFVELEAALVLCSRRYAALAGVAACHGVALWAGLGPHNHHGAARSATAELAVAVAEAAHGGAVAFFMWVASACFAEIVYTRGTDVAWLLAGVSDLGAVLGEVAIMSTGLAFLHVALAASLWVGVFPLVACLTAAATLGRAWVHRRPERFAAALAVPKRAMYLATVPLRLLSRAERAAWARRARARRAHGRAGGSGAAPAGVPRPRPAEAAIEVAEYEFDTRQEQVFRAAIRGLFLACLARLLLAASDGLVCAACVASGAGAPRALSAAASALEVAASSGLFWGASHALDDVITTTGRDVSHVLRGLGPRAGLARMFRRLAHVVEASILIKLAPDALPALAEGGRWAVGAAVAAASGAA